MARITLSDVVPDRLQPPPWKENSFGLAETLEEEFEELHFKLPQEYRRTGSEEERLKRLFEQIHQLPAGRSALCLSGGGIRSASFALGFVQGLARCGLLNSFDFLSTVSGGGYLGGWLSAWSKHAGSFESVSSALGHHSGDVLNPEPAPVSHLRAYSNFLTPRLGLFSADTWTLVATVLRNLILNWLVLIPLIAAITLLPRLWFDILGLAPGSAKPAWFVAVILFLVAIVYTLIDLPSLFDRRLPQWSFLAFCLAPTFLAVYVAETAWAWSSRVYWLSVRSDAASLLKYGAYAAGAIFLLAGAGAFIRKRHGMAALTLAVAGAVSAAWGGAGSWLLTHRIFPHPLRNPELYVSIAPALLLLIIALVAVLFVGLSSRVTNDEDREWWSRAGAWVLIATVVPAAANVLFLYGAKIPGSLHISVAPLASIGGISGLITALVGFSKKTLSQPRSDSSKKTHAFGRNLLLALAAPVFVAVLLILISAGIAAAEQGVHPYVLGPEEWVPLIADTTILGLLILVGVLMSGFVHVNKFSLHAMYRNRLVRAFLGASREKRDSNRFTGFDSQDNVDMKDLLPKRPLHIVNITLNLVQDYRLAWQQRKAESFTVSRLHSGGHCVGYRQSGQYGDGISLGTAVTISGAAASPNMGYHSSPAVTLLMTLFNARLGWWLGNPGSHGDTTWYRPGPRFALRALLSEALGFTNDRNPYVYLSDGGHFENLGLYEMVLRRCHLIVVADAGEDKELRLGDLGNAVRKIRIDFGIPIVFRSRPIGDLILPEGKCCAIADIRYSEVDGGKTDGVLVYVKPRLTGREPADVRNYAAIHLDFPHQATTDQWFDEPQFESYRMLGLHVISELCGNFAGPLDGLAIQIATYLGQRNAPTHQTASDLETLRGASDERPQST